MTRVHPESDSDSDLEISDSSDAEFADPTTEVHGKRQYCAYWYCGGCCFDHHDHHLVKYVSAPAALLTFDIFFFLTFAVGWIITAIFNPDAIDDNAITRVFGVYNICIGVDSNPARLVCIPLSYFSVFCLVVAVLLHLQRIRAQPHATWNQANYKTARIMLLLTALAFSVLFSWSIGVEPVGRENVKYHLYGFACGLIGYALLKVVSVIEFFHGRKANFQPCSTRKHVFFLVIELSSAVFILIFSAVLFQIMASKSDDELDALLEQDTPTDTNFDWGGLVLIIVTAFGPPLVCVYGPNRRHSTISVHYVAVGADCDDGEQIPEPKKERGKQRAVIRKVERAKLHTEQRVRQTAEQFKNAALPSHGNAQKTGTLPMPDEVAAEFTSAVPNTDHPRQTQKPQNLTLMERQSAHEEKPQSLNELKALQQQHVLNKEFAKATEVQKEIEDGRAWRMESLKAQRTPRSSPSSLGLASSVSATTRSQDSNHSMAGMDGPTTNVQHPQQEHGAATQIGEAMAEPSTVEAPEAAATTESPLPDLRASGTPAAWRGAKGPRHLPRIK